MLEQHKNCLIKKIIFVLKHLCEPLGGNMHHKKAMAHIKKAMDHLSMHHDQEPGQKISAKKHEAKAGRKANKSKKHHKAQAKGMKKAMMGM